MTGTFGKVRAGSILRMLVREARWTKSSDLFLSLMVATVALAVAVAVLTIVRAHHIQENGGLGSDGVMYAGMVRGLLEPAPWGQRILSPFIVHLLDPSTAHLVNAFLLVNMVAFAAIVAGAGVLARRIALRGHASPRNAWVAAIMTGALLVVLPFGFRWIWFDPVLVDPVASALGVWWFVASTSGPMPIRWAAIPLAGLAVVAHQIWGPILVAGTITQIVASRDRASLRVSLATLIAISAGIWTDLAAPTRGTLGLDTLQEAIQAYVTFADTAYNAENLTWALLFTFGILPLVLGRREVVRSILSMRWWTGRPREAAIILPIGTMAVLCVLESIAVGNDEQRYFFYASAPFLVPLVVAYTAINPAATIRLMVASIASITVWQPFYSGVEGTGMASFFSPQFSPPGVVARLGTTLEALTLPAMLSLVIVLLWERRSRGGTGVHQEERGQT